MVISGGKEFKTVLHQLVSVYSSIIDELLLRSGGTSYSAHFMIPDSESMGENITIEQQEICYQVYLWGVLERCHLTSLTSLARTNRWLESSLAMLEQENLLGFSASLRGLLEATADTYDASDVMIGQLYRFFPYIYLRVAKNDNRANGVILEHLENRLIHYSYAQRQSGNTNPLPEHANKTNASYIRAIEQGGALGAQNLYKRLCELTHPAAPSVSCFLRETPQEIILDFSQDRRIIEEIVLEYQETIKNLVTLTVNSALLTLSILSRIGFGGVALHQDYFSTIDRAANILNQIDGFLLKAEADGFLFSEEMWSFKI